MLMEDAEYLYSSVLPVLFATARCDASDKEIPMVAFARAGGIINTIADHGNRCRFIERFNYS